MKLQNFKDEEIEREFNEKPVSLINKTRTPPKGICVKGFSFFVISINRVVAYNHDIIGQSTWNRILFFIPNFLI